LTTGFKLLNVSLKDLNQRVKELELIIQNLENELKVRNQENGVINSNIKINP